MIYWAVNLIKEDAERQDSTLHNFGFKWAAEEQMRILSKAEKNDNDPREQLVMAFLPSNLTDNIPKIENLIENYISEIIESMENIMMDTKYRLEQEHDFEGKEQLKHVTNEYREYKNSESLPPKNSEEFDDILKKELEKAVNKKRITMK